MPLFPHLFVCLLLVGLATTPVAAQDVAVDSALTPEQAIHANQPPDVLPEVQDCLVVVDVRHHGYDGRIHQGQVVIHAALADDVRKAFDVILQSGFPVESVLPIAHPAIVAKAPPYGLSPDTNNSSGYVWRPMAAGKALSLHALGLALDINPRRNPYIKGDLVLPPGAAYNATQPGTLTAGSPVVRAFKALGWEWGGDWNAGKVDYMHFQKIPAGLQTWVASHRKP